MRHTLHLSARLLLAVTLLPLAANAAPRKQKAPADEGDESRMTSSTFSGLELRGIGPALMAGRVADIAIDPQNPSTWFVAFGSGGVWKTTTAGTTWEPIFDGQGSYSVGCVTLDPSNPEIVWVGTGENVGGRHVGFGDGVYKSLDGGASWTNMGLGTSEHIGKIVVDPTSSATVYVAAQGPLWSAGGERGLFKTTDAGATWTKLLGGGEYTGVNDVVLDPRRPQVLIAATHQRFRTVAALIDGGPESAIHKSTDGGVSWRQLEKGLPDADKGRIGLAISPIDPDIVYATIELAHREGGFYRSSDGGESWNKQSDLVSGGTGPHYYQEIFASPHKLDRVYQVDPSLHVSEDGGRTFTSLPNEVIHGDYHALAFHPTDPDYLLTGSDGGVYESWDLGQHWRFAANLPVTQFYKVAVDYDAPFYHVIGGTQDNNTQYGPARTGNVSGIRNADWQVTLFGDGHQPAIDPSDPNILYSEWQEGNLTRFDRSSGEVIHIQPQPEKGEEQERFNWDSPILISPHDPATLFYASQRVWRSDDRGDSWRPISGDLSRGRDRLDLPMMGRVWSFDAVWDLWAMSKYGTVTSLAQSPLDEGLIYAGTDDGLIQVTEDGGESWRKIEHLPGVPDYYFVNDLKADLFDADTVYAAVDSHKIGDFRPLVLESTDRGRSWRSIAGDLPERHLVWRLVQDHVDPDLLFLATEYGIFFTVDGGGKWIELEGGAPTISFRDLAIQRRENDLVGASFGRGFWILDDYSPLREVSEEALAQPAELFPVRDALWYIEKRPLGFGEKGSQGDSYFTAPNPPFGALFTYYLKEGLTTRKEARREREKEIAEQGGDTPYPGWGAIRREETEEEPTVLLTVRNDQGKVVRRVTGPVDAGFHRVAWDLRYPALDPVTEAGGDPDDERTGYLAPPGTYTVSLGQRVDGVETDLGKSRSFKVVPLDWRGLKGGEPAAVAGFMRQLAEFERVVEATRELLEEVENDLDLARAALLSSTVNDSDLDDAVRALERRVQELHLRLAGSETRDLYGDPGPANVFSRLSAIQVGNFLSTYGPTPTHQRQLQIAREEFAEIHAAFEAIVGTELPELSRRLEAAGVPWSPGRGLPGQ